MIKSVAVPPLVVDRMEALDSTIPGPELVQALELLCIAPWSNVHEFVLSDDDRVIHE